MSPRRTSVSPIALFSSGSQCGEIDWTAGAAKDAQEKLERVGLTMDERAMPQATDAPGRELDIAHVGSTAEKETDELETTLAEAATRCEPLTSVAARLARSGGDENALWLTANESPGGTPLDNMEFRFVAKMRLDLPVVQGGLRQHQRRHKSDGTAGATCLAIWMITDSMLRNVLLEGDRSKAARCGAATMPVVKQGSSRNREVIVPALATEKLTEPRVDVDAWGHPGLLHVTVVHAEALHYSSAKKRRQLRHERKRANTGERKEEWESLASISVQFSGFGRGLDALLRKNFCNAATILSATRRKDSRGTQCAIALFSCCAVRDRTTPR